MTLTWIKRAGFYFATGERATYRARRQNDGRWQGWYADHRADLSAAVAAAQVGSFWVEFPGGTFPLLKNVKANAASYEARGLTP